MRHLSLCALTAIGMAIAVPTAPASADVLVTRSSGEAGRQYVRGMRLQMTDVLTLAAGDSVTILTSRGTRTFRGPGRYRVDSMPSLARTSFWPPRHAEVARTAVARGRGSGQEPAEPAIEKPGPGTDEHEAETTIWSGAPVQTDILRFFEPLWAVDLSQGGNFCYLSQYLIKPRYGATEAGRNADALILARTDIENGPRESLDYSGPSGIIWDGNSEIQIWPESLTIEPGAIYSASFEGSDHAPVTTRFLQLETDIFGELDPTVSQAEFLFQIFDVFVPLAAELEERGCDRQHELIGPDLEEMRVGLEELRAALDAVEASAPDSGN